MKKESNTVLSQIQLLFILKEMLKENNSRFEIRKLGRM
jgi:hypothetical protein